MWIFGKILGWFMVAFYSLAVLNYPVKWVNKRVISKLPANSGVRKIFTVLMRFIVKYHRYFAIAAILLLTAHFFVQFSLYGFFLTGIIAGSLMLAQGLLGAYGTYVRKKKRTAWFYLHRTVAVLLLAAILIHVIIKRF